MFKNLRPFILFSILFLIGFANIPAQDPPPPPKPTPPPTRTTVRGIQAGAQDVEPPARSTVSGRVYYENTGRPVRRSSIMLMEKTGGPGRAGTALTDANGFFEIKNVAAGTYYPLINAPGVVSPLAYADFSAPRESEGMKNAFKNFTPIEVNGINDVQVQIAAKQGGAISGRITYSNGDPAIGVRVEILRKVEDKFVPVIPNFSSIFAMFGGGGGETDDRGVYRYSGLPEGEYIVKVTEKAAHGSNSDDSPFGGIGGMFAASSLLTVYFPDVFDTSKAQIINVILGQENYETNLTIHDRELFVVEGKVVAARDGKPIENAKLGLKRVGDNTASFLGRIQEELGQQNQSDDKGVWNFKELPRGTYKLTVVPPDPEIDYPLDEDYPGNTSIAVNKSSGRGPSQKQEPKFARTIREITITDQDLSNLTIELGFGAVITGTVFTENSTEMPLALSVSVADEGGTMVSVDTVINYSFEGDKSFDVDKSEIPANIMMPGEVQEVDHTFSMEGVPVGKARFQVSVDDDDYYVKSATLKGVNLLTDMLELKEGDKLDGVKIVLAKDVGTVNGTILDGRNRPVKNMDFALVPVNPARRRINSFYKFVSTDLDGEFTVKAAPDEYAMVIFDPAAMQRDLPGFYTWLDGVIGDAPKVSVKAGETEKVTFKIP